MPVVRLSALEHYRYCPRQCALIHADGLWEENAHTMRGQYGHRRVDSGEHRRERGHLVLRSIPLWSETFGLSGRADAVEVHGRRVVPVEYKIGVRHGDAAHLQLAAQALCLEEMLEVRVDEGAIWFSSPRRRESVLIDDELRAQTLEVIGQIRSILLSESLPGAPDDERCNECQFLAYCMPSVVSNDEAVSGELDRGLWSCVS